VPAGGTNAAPVVLNVAPAAMNALAVRLARDVHSFPVLPVAQLALEFQLASIGVVPPDYDQCASDQHSGWELRGVRRATGWDERALQPEAHLR